MALYERPNLKSDSEHETRQHIWGSVRATVRVRIQVVVTAVTALGSVELTATLF